MKSESQEKQVINVAQEFGPHLVGREMGARLREAYFRLAPTAWPALNFKGVTQITESCVDEFMGALVRQWGLEEALSHLVFKQRRPEVRAAFEFVSRLLKAPSLEPPEDDLMKALGAKSRRTH